MSRVARRGRPRLAPFREPQAARATSPARSSPQCRAAANCIRARLAQHRERGFVGRATNALRSRSSRFRCFDAAPRRYDEPHAARRPSSQARARSSSKSPKSLRSSRARRASIRAAASNSARGARLLDFAQGDLPDVAVRGRGDFRARVQRRAHRGIPCSTARSTATHHRRARRRRSAIRAAVRAVSVCGPPAGSAGSRHGPVAIRVGARAARGARQRDGDFLARGRAAPDVDGPVALEDRVIREDCPHQRFVRRVHRARRQDRHGRPHPSAMRSL